MTDFDDEYDPIFDDLAPDEIAAGIKSKDYEVGYCKPPVHSQFKKGQSGNKKGRRKGIRNFATDAKAALAVPVKVNKDGKTKKVSSQYAVILKLREMALKGDARAIDKMIDLAMTFSDDDLASIRSNLGADDKEVLNFYESSVLARAEVNFNNQECDQTDSAKVATEIRTELNNERENDDDILK